MEGFVTVLNSENFETVMDSVEFYERKSVIAGSERTSSLSPFLPTRSLRSWISCFYGNDRVVMDEDWVVERISGFYG